MPFTPVGAGRQDDDAPRTYLNPSDIVGHLLIVWPVRYETDTATKYPRQDGRPSDAVYVDIVDLNLPDELNQPGKVMRAAKWTQGRLIRDTKHAIGVPREDAMLVQMGKDGDAYQIVDQATNPGAVEYASRWLAAHPQFHPGQDAPQPRDPQPQSSPWPPATGQQSGQWNPPVSGPPQSESTMDRLRRQAQSSNPYAPQPGLPTYPNPGQQDENPPF
jgi:hypothetical protein